MRNDAAMHELTLARKRFRAAYLHRMRTHPFSTPRWRPRPVLVAALFSTGALSGCLRNPAADAATAQALTEIADRLGAMQQESAELQNQVDSLRVVVARQDTILRRVANLAGVPMAP
jgi:hypothetical protein